MEFNPQVLLLFANAFLTTALSVLIVGTILLREYLPTIRRLKQSAADSAADPSETTAVEPRSRS